MTAVVSGSAGMSFMAAEVAMIMSVSTGSCMLLLPMMSGELTGLNFVVCKRDLYVLHPR